MAFGLLKREGTLKQDELYERVAALVHPGDWCSPKLVSALLRKNTQQFKVLASGLVATHDVSNVQALAVRKRAHRWLPQHPWTAEELLAIAERRETFSERETAIGNELSCLTGLEISVRALQSELQQGTSVAVVVSSLERHYGVSDPQALQRAKELLTELYRYTPL